MRPHHPCEVTDCGNTATGTVANPHVGVANAVKVVCQTCRDEMIATMGYHIVEPIRPTGRDDQTQINAAIRALPNWMRATL